FSIAPAIPYDHGLRLEAIHTCGITAAAAAAAAASHQDRASVAGYCAYRDSCANEKAERLRQGRRVRDSVLLVCPAEISTCTSASG
ncbi:Uncharacterized protein DBV15_07560, partial [Temnothorax longispinosus]